MVQEAEHSVRGQPVSHISVSNHNTEVQKRNDNKDNRETSFELDLGFQEFEAADASGIEHTLSRGVCTTNFTGGGGEGLRQNQDY